MRERKIEKSDHSRSIENANNNNHRIRHVHFIVFTTNQLCVVFGSVCSLFTFAYLVSVSLQLEALSMWLSLCTERSTACVDVCAVGLFVWDRSCLCLCPFRSFQFSSVNSCAEFISVCSATIYSMCIVYACFRFAFMHLAQFADAIFWSIATCMMNGRPSKRKNAKSCGHRWSSSECSKLIWAIYKVTRSARVDHFAQANAFFFHSPAATFSQFHFEFTYCSTWRVDLVGFDEMYGRNACVASNSNWKLLLCWGFFWINSCLVVAYTPLSMSVCVLYMRYSVRFSANLECIASEE